jgi:hypothetical protein
MEKYVEEAQDIVADAFAAAYKICSKHFHVDLSEVMTLTNLILEVANGLKDEDLSKQLEESTKEDKNKLDMDYWKDI